MKFRPADLALLGAIVVVPSPHAADARETAPEQRPIWFMIQRGECRPMFEVARDVFQKDFDTPEGLVRYGQSLGDDVTVAYYEVVVGTGSGTYAKIFSPPSSGDYTFRAYLSLRVCRNAAQAVAQSATQIPQQPQPQPGLAQWRNLGNGMGFPYGMVAKELVSAYPGVDCSGNFCQVPERRQDLCPGGEKCWGLEMFLKENRIVGFSVDYDATAWGRLYRATQDKYGDPKRKYLPAGDVLRFSTDISIWSFDIGDLEFTKRVGVNVYGKPVASPFSIMFVPREVATPKP